MAGQALRPYSNLIQRVLIFDPNGNALSSPGREEGEVLAGRLPNLIYRFEKYLLDVNRRELRRGTVLLPIEPQVFDLLAFLVSNRDRVVSKDDLLASVWGGRIVSESTLASRINAVRRAIGDSGEEQRLIRTIFGKGLRFVGEVQEQLVAGEVSPDSSSPHLSVVVLPFTNFSSDPVLDHFADGITDDLTTDLARLSGIVIARNTAFTFKRRSIDVARVGRELGVHYVVEGSVRPAGDRVRINVQLTDAETEAHLWADRFDVDPANFAPALNDILGPVALTLHLRILKAAGQRIEQRVVPDPVPGDLFIRALAMLAGAASAAGLQEALQTFGRALEMDPSSVPIKWGIGYALCINVAWCWSTSVPQDLARAEPLLVKASEQEPNNFRVRTALGFLRRLQNRLEESRIELEKAITLAPNYPDASWLLALTLVTLGQPDLAVIEMERGLRLSSPGTATPVADTVLTLSYLLSGRAEEAIEPARRACADNPRSYVTHMFLAAALGLKGEINEAKAALGRAIKIRPEFNSLARVRAYCTWGSARYWELHERTIAQGLRRAGMPDK